MTATTIPTPDELKDIFYSGYPGAISWQIIDELYLMLNNNCLVYDQIDSVSS